MKFRFTNRLKYLQDTLLYQSVPDTRNPQWSGLSVILWDFYPSNLFGLIIVQLVSDSFNDRFDRN